MFPAEFPTPQPDVHTLGDERWDAVVIGAGPAGSVLARELARAGHRVLVLERRRFPRDKACGDGLIPDAIGVLRRLGLLERIAARAASWSTSTVYGPFGASIDVDVAMLTIRREVLDAELATAAVEAGAMLACGLVRDVRDEGDHVSIELSDGTALSARIACIATGANVALLDACGLLERAAPSAVALRTYVHATLALDRPIVSFDRRILPGYGWIFPMGGGVFNVGCGVISGATPPDLRAMLDRFLATFSVGRALVASDAHREAVRGATLRFGLTGARAHNGGRILAVGESIGTTYPLTGEGIGKAMESALLAARAVDDALGTGGSIAPLAAYPGRIADVLGPRYEAYRVAQRWMAVPGLADALFLRARRRPRLRGAFAGLLNETVDARRALTIGGLWRALTA